jgi:hypothetical protein
MSYLIYTSPFQCHWEDASEKYEICLMIITNKWFGEYLRLHI